LKRRWELYSQPTNCFVEGFLGSPAMNFIETDFVISNRARCAGLRPEYLEVVEKSYLAWQSLPLRAFGK
jgi:ABC-type sugar transport system ATPase subunit